MPDPEATDEPLAGEQPRFSADSLLEDLVAARLFGPTTPPATIGRFTVLDLIGSGGMGRVYAAHDPDLDRKVAIKVVRNVPGPEESLALAQARLTREARVLAQLNHPNVVEVHECGVHDQQVYLVMELVHGVTLDSWLRERVRPWTEVLALVLAAGEGLASAHALGIVHRDFKATNVIVGTDGRPRVVDFGLARPMSARPPAAAPTASGPTTFDYSITGTGRISGTPGYLAPELLGGARASPRSDIYAYCVTLLEAADARSTDAMPGEIIDVALRGLVEDPSKRWSDMPQLLDALRGAAREVQRRITRVRIGWAIGLGALVLGLGGLVLGLGAR